MIVGLSVPRNTLDNELDACTLRFDLVGYQFQRHDVDAEDKASLLQSELNRRDFVQIDSYNELLLCLLLHHLTAAFVFWQANSSMAYQNQSLDFLRLLQSVLRNNDYAHLTKERLLLLQDSDQDLEPLNPYRLQIQNLGHHNDHKLRMDY